MSGLREINLLMNLKHENIVPLREIVVGKHLNRSEYVSVYFLRIGIIIAASDKETL